MATQVQPLAESVSLAELRERRIAVDSALGTTLAEGVSPGDDVIALGERYANGEITLEEMGSAVRRLSGI